MQQIGFWGGLAALPLITAALAARARIGLGWQPGAPSGAPPSSSASSPRCSAE